MKKNVIFISFIFLMNLFAQNKMQIWETGIRGVNIKASLKQSDLVYIRNNWGANAIRVAFKRVPLQEYEPPYKFVDENWARIDSICNYAKKVGLFVIIDPHSFPGIETREIRKTRVFWKSKELQKNFIFLWQRLAQKLKNRPEIIGYDVFNEPVLEKVKYAKVFKNLFTRLYHEIRKIDKETPIIIQPPSEKGHPRMLELVDFISEFDGVILSTHFYHPKEYSLQGTRGYNKDIVYPGDKAKLYINKKWKKVVINKFSLKKALFRFKEFEKKYNVPVYVGEFCAIRYVKGSDRWVKDVIDVFEEFGWSWTYQAFRAGTLCDAELGIQKDNKKIRFDNNNRIKILKKAFNKNNVYLPSF